MYIYAERNRFTHLGHLEVFGINSLSENLSVGIKGIILNSFCASEHAC